MHEFGDGIYHLDRLKDMLELKAPCKIGLWDDDYLKQLNDANIDGVKAEYGSRNRAYDSIEPVFDPSVNFLIHVVSHIAIEKLYNWIIDYRKNKRNEKKNNIISDSN